MHQKIAIVTGASSGLGREYVKLLANRKELAEIWAIARNGDKLAQLKTECSKVKPISMDLSVPENIIAFQEQLAAEQPDILYLINNAGFAKFCASTDLSIAESVNMVNLNCNGMVAMSLACIPYMQPGSHLLNVASQASFQPLPYMNLYSATKAFVRGYSRALHVELHQRGITVTAVCPGWMDTALFERAEIGAPKGANRFYGMVKPRRVAAKSLRDSRRGRDMSVYSLFVKLEHLAAKLLPQRLMMQLWLKQQHL